MRILDIILFHFDFHCSRIRSQHTNHRFDERKYISKYLCVWVEVEGEGEGERDNTNTSYTHRHVIVSSVYRYTLLHNLYYTCHTWTISSLFSPTQTLTLLSAFLSFHITCRAFLSLASLLLVHILAAQIIHADS